MPPVFPAVKADSIAELAGKIGLDPQTLASTVESFNAAVRDGTFDHTELDDCRTEGLDPPKTHWARRLDSPPYYATPLKPALTFTYLDRKSVSEGKKVKSQVDYGVSRQTTQNNISTVNDQ